MPALLLIHPLGREHIRKFAEIQLNHLRSRLADSDLQMEVSDQVMELLGKTGFDPVHGARPLKRAKTTLPEALSAGVRATKTNQAVSMRTWYSRSCCLINSRSSA